MVDQAQRLREISVCRKGDNCSAAKRRAFRTIVVSSGKGGVGKSNLVVNLALSLTQLGQRVIIFDADLGMANVDILLDMEPLYTLWDVVKGTRDLRDIMLVGPANLKVIPGASGFQELANMDSQQRNRLIERITWLEGEADILLIDTGTGLSRNVLSFIAAADELVVITTPEPTAVTDAYGVIKVVAGRRLHSKVFLVVNQIREMAEGDKIGRRITGVCRQFLQLNLQYLGGIYYDPLVIKAVKKRRPFVLSYPRSRAAWCVQRIAERLLYQDSAGMPREGLSGFLSRLVQLLG